MINRNLMWFGGCDILHTCIDLYVYIFFDRVTSADNLVMATAEVGEAVSSKVELSLSCSNLKDLDVFSKSDPVVFLYEQKGSEWVKLGRTEVIDDNLNPKVQQSAAVSSPLSSS